MKGITVTLLSAWLAFGNPVRAETPSIAPTVEHGALMFNQRCTMCHGNLGLGDGILPRVIPDYPNTNLRAGSINPGIDTLRETIIYGYEQGILDERMPPFGDELTWLEIESLVLFLRLFYRDSERAIAVLARTRPAEAPSLDKGRAIYKGRCILCHGVNGDGKGKLSRIIKSPPPFNFQWSRLPDPMLFEIITRGGDAVGRSPKMPAFGEELDEADIRSLILYIKGFRG